MNASLRLACPEGIEPPTHSLEGCCSIQLSYGQRSREKIWSGRKDSNLRPSGPKPDALPGCATPRHARIVTGRNTRSLGKRLFLREQTDRIRQNWHLPPTAWATFCPCHLSRPGFHGLHRVKTSRRPIMLGGRTPRRPDSWPPAVNSMLTPCRAPTARESSPGSARANPCCGGVPIPEWCLMSPNSGCTPRSRKPCRNSARPLAARFAWIRLLIRSFRRVHQAHARARRALGSCPT